MLNMVTKPLVTAIAAVNAPIRLRPYQFDIKQAANAAWGRGDDNVLLVLPTGAGKTITFSSIIHDHVGATCAIAHRQELVSQISLALAKHHVRHRIIGPKSVIKLCVNLQMLELGRSYYDPQADCAVAGVDTLIRRKDSLGAWLQKVTLWVQDEAHHVTKCNKWGSAVEMFPNAKGLGVTATPLRADGKGLGKHSDGVFDTLIEGPSMRQLIDMGYLTDYRIFAPESDLDMADEVAGKSGDWSNKQLRNAAKKSHIVGDVVANYQRFAVGKLGVTFATDVDTAADIANSFTAAGVSAAVVSAKTPDAERVEILRRFKRREVMVLVNVDLFGEGFDLPAIEVVIFARPTQSYGLYVQQFGRVLRLMVDPSLYPIWDDLTDAQRLEHIANSSKPNGIIIDHVGNVVRHGLPDAYRTWTLDARAKRGGGGGSSIPIRVCPECMFAYEAVSKTCPACGHYPQPAARSGPEFVDGNLLELDAATLAAMRGEVEKIDMSEADLMQDMAARYVPHIGQLSGLARHRKNKEGQEALRVAIAWWAGHQRALGRSDDESYMRFYHRFGIDVLSAQALKRKESLPLAEQIIGVLAEGIE